MKACTATLAMSFGKLSATVDKECAGCGVRSLIGRSKSYCSKSCWLTWIKANGKPKIDYGTGICAQCGEEYPHTRNKANQRATCSDSCAKILQAAGRARGSEALRTGAHGKNNSRVCLSCKQNFTIAKGDNKRKLCSGKCEADWARKCAEAKYVDATCHECKLPYRQRACDAAYGRKFCQNSCRIAWLKRYLAEEVSGENHPSFIPGTAYNYGPSWKVARQSVWERDNHACVGCGITAAEQGKECHVHHITPFRLFGRERHEEANNLENLVSLCPRCHKIEEHKAVQLLTAYIANGIPQNACVITKDILGQHERMTPAEAKKARREALPKKANTGPSRRFFHDDTHQECGGCREVKLHAEFVYRSRKGVPQVTTQCKQCAAKYYREKRFAL